MNKFLCCAPQLLSQPHETFGPPIKDVRHVDRLLDSASERRIIIVVLWLFLSKRQQLGLHEIFDHLCSAHLCRRQHLPLVALSNLARLDCELSTHVADHLPPLAQYLCRCMEHSEERYHKQDTLHAVSGETAFLLEGQRGQVDAEPALEGDDCTANTRPQGLDTSKWPKQYLLVRWGKAQPCELHVCFQCMHGTPECLLCVPDT